MSENGLSKERLAWIYTQMVRIREFEERVKRTFEEHPGVIRGHTHLADNRDHPLGPFLYTISCLHCMSVSLAAGGPGLGAMWGREQAVRMLTDAGFRDAIVDELPHDPINYYYIARKDA